jgi:hypothetical protein
MVAVDDMTIVKGIDQSYIYGKKVFYDEKGAAQKMLKYSPTFESITYMDDPNGWGDEHVMRDDVYGGDLKLPLIRNRLRLLAITALVSGMVLASKPWRWFRRRQEQQMGGA